MKRITVHTNLLKWEEGSKFSALKIKEETCTMLRRSRTLQTQKEERSWQCGGLTTGVPHKLDERQQYQMARKKSKYWLFHVFSPYSLLVRVLVVPSLYVLILWAPKSILFTSALHTRCILLLLQTLRAILVLLLNKRLKDITCAGEFRRGTLYCEADKWIYDLTQRPLRLVQVINGMQMSNKVFWTYSGRIHLLP